jgi:hypothetical protein
MFKRILLISLCLTLFFSNLSVFATDTLTIQLLFPKKSYAKATPPKALLEPKEVSGNLIIDISPYPDKIEEGRYLVEYFLDDQLLYQTTGFNEDNPDILSFSYILDTTRFEDGPHKIIINFWDEAGPSAIGIRQIIINNENE